MSALESLAYTVVMIAGLIYIGRAVVDLGVRIALSKAKKLIAHFNKTMEAIQMSVTPRVDDWWASKGKHKAIAFAEKHPLPSFLGELFFSEGHDLEDHPVVKSIYHHALGLAIHTAAEDMLQQRIATALRFAPNSEVGEKLSAQLEEHTNDHRMALVEAGIDINEIEALARPA